MTQHLRIGEFRGKVSSLKDVTYVYQYRKLAGIYIPIDKLAPPANKPGAGDVSHFPSKSGKPKKFAADK